MSHHASPSDLDRPGKSLHCPPRRTEPPGVIDFVAASDRHRRTTTGPQ